MIPQVEASISLALLSFRPFGFSHPTRSIMANSSRPGVISNVTNERWAKFGQRNSRRFFDRF